MSLLEQRYAAEVDIRPTRYARWKALAEPPLALLLAVLTAPMMLVVAAMIRLTSRGPAILRQERTGRGGRSFVMYKFRTMNHDAEADSGPVWCRPDDPRITRVGAWLRRHHLDELPQLFNIIKGEMSFVGPRPERPEIIVELLDAIPGYVNRWAVLPGVTGLAQINLPSDQTVEDAARKQQLDIEYIQTANWWLDVRAVMVAALRVFGFRSEVLVGLFGLKREPWGAEPAEGPSEGGAKVEAGSGLAMLDSELGAVPSIAPTDLES